MLSQQSKCSQLKWVAANVREIVGKAFPNDPTAVWNAVGSFYFLRFFCPAIVTPVHYNILQSQCF